MHNDQHSFFFAAQRGFETSGYYEEIDPEEPNELPALKGYRSLSRRISKLKPDQSSKPAWLLQLIGRGVVIAGSTVT